MTTCSLCGTPDAGLYPAGWRCPHHTPARLAGRPEPPTPDTPSNPPSDLEQERLIENAIARQEREQTEKERHARYQHRRSA